MLKLSASAVVLIVVILSAALSYYLYLEKRSYSYQQVAPLAWMHKSIDNDLKMHKAIKANSIALAKELIDAGKLPNAFIVEIANGKVNYYPPKNNKRAQIIVGHLQVMLDGGAKLPNTKFILGAGDKWESLDLLEAQELNSLPPVFVFAASKHGKYRNKLVLFPDDHTLGDHLIGYRKGWTRVYNEVAQLRGRLPFEKRLDLLVWRGLPTDVSNYPGVKSPRTLLVEMSKQRPDVIDANFNEVSWGNEFVIKVLRPFMQMFSIPPYFSYAKQMEYKYTLVIDGHTCTYPGLLWRLYSYSLVLKQESDDEQWFYGLLTPWQHYVPVKKYMEDLIEKVQWARLNEAQAIAMTERAGNLIDVNLQPKHIDAYISLLLNQYAAGLDSKKVEQ